MRYLWESLRQSLMERHGLNEKQIYFEERDENGMTPNGDRLFVECNASSVGKRKSAEFTRKSFLRIMRMVFHWNRLPKNSGNEIRKLKTAGFLRNKNLNNYEKVKNDLLSGHLM